MCLSVCIYAHRFCVCPTMNMAGKSFKETLRHLDTLRLSGCSLDIDLWPGCHYCIAAFVHVHPCRFVGKMKSQLQEADQYRSMATSFFLTVVLLWHGFEATVAARSLDFRDDSSLADQDDLPNLSQFSAICQC